MLELDHVTKKYLRRTALDDVSMRVEAGRTCLLLGPNGSGKTTLMKLVAGLSRPTSGEIRFDGMPIGAGSKARVAYMPTENYFYNYMTVKDAGKYYADFFADFDPRRFNSLLNAMELDPADRVRQLSSGMAAKLRLSLTLSRDAGLMMFDEPLNGVDILTRTQTIDAILVGCLQSDIHSYDVLIRNIHVTLDQSTTDEAVASADDVYLEFIFLKVLHDFENRLVEGLAVRHSFKSVHVAEQDLCHEICKLVESKPRIRAGCLDRVLHRHVLREGVVQRTVSERPSDFEHLGIGFDGGIFQDPPRQHIVLQIGRKQFAVDGSVHIKYRDAVDRRDIVRRSFIGHALHIIDQCFKSRSPLIPFREDLLILIFCCLCLSSNRRK